MIWLEKTRGIWSYFNKLKNGKYDEDDLINATFHKCYESPEAWVKKSDVKEQSPLFMFVSDKLYPILKFSEEKRPEMGEGLQERYPYDEASQPVAPAG